MKKLTLSLLFSLLSIIARAFTGIVEIGDLKYNIVTKGKTAEVIGLASGKLPTDIVIPGTIEYEGVICNVSSIGQRAFLGCTELTNVSIPNSVTSIGEAAFAGCI